MEQMKLTIKEMLIDIGENPDREGLQDTPNRVAKMWNELYRGYDINQKPKTTVFNNNGDGLNYDQMIHDTGYFYSQCEHHMVPFFGTYHFAYIPNKKILGLGDYKRVVITGGHRGSFAYSKEEGLIKIPVFSEDIVDRIGAGDAYFSITSPCVAKGYPMELVGFIGNAVGALAVKIIGNKKSIEPEALYKFVNTLLKWG